MPRVPSSKLTLNTQPAADPPSSGDKNKRSSGSAPSSPGHPVGPRKSSEPSSSSTGPRAAVPTLGLGSPRSMAMMALGGLAVQGAFARPTANFPSNGTLPAVSAGPTDDARFPFDSQAATHLTQAQDKARREDWQTAAATGASSGVGLALGAVALAAATVAARKPLPTITPASDDRRGPGEPFERWDRIVTHHDASLGHVASGSEPRTATDLVVGTPTREMKWAQLKRLKPTAMAVGLVSSAAALGAPVANVLLRHATSTAAKGALAAVGGVAAAIAPVAGYAAVQTARGTRMQRLQRMNAALPILDNDPQGHMASYLQKMFDALPPDRHERVKEFLSANMNRDFPAAAQPGGPALDLGEVLRRLGRPDPGNARDHERWHAAEALAQQHQLWHVIMTPATPEESTFAATVRDNFALQRQELDGESLDEFLARPSTARQFRQLDHERMLEAVGCVKALPQDNANLDDRRNWFQRLTPVSATANLVNIRDNLTKAHDALAPGDEQKARFAAVIEVVNGLLGTRLPTEPALNRPAAAAPATAQAASAATQAYNAALAQAQLPSFDTVHGLAGYLCDQLLTPDGRLPRRLVLGEGHGGIGSLAAGLVLMLLRSQEPGQHKHALMLEATQQELANLGLTDGDSDVIRLVQDNLDNGRSVLHGFAHNHNMSAADVAHNANVMTLAAMAHRLGMAVEGFNPLHSSTEQARRDPDFWQLEEAEMRQALAQASQGRTTIAITGAVHVLPLTQAPQGPGPSAQPAAVSLMYPIPPGRDEFLDRFNELLSRQGAMPLLRVVGEMHGPTDPAAVPKLLDDVQQAVQHLAAQRQAASGSAA